MQVKGELYQAVVFWAGWIMRIVQTGRGDGKGKKPSCGLDGSRTLTIE
jgi:hypothetical protein